MSKVLSFAEESCWDGETFRSIRRPVVFSLKLPKISFDREFTADFGVFYDFDDEWLIQILDREFPAIDWGRFVFFKKLDHSAIQLIDTEIDRVVGEIVVRGSQKGRILPDQLPEGVVCLDKWRKSAPKSADATSV